jgi:hypothetical protein
MGNGLGAWSSAPDAEVYGSIIFNNGWGAPDRPHGHGIYLQNRDGAKLVRDNIVFNQFGAGIHAYGSSEAHLDSIQLEGNVVFNSGALAAHPGANILVGGGVVANRPELKHNFTYHDPRRNSGANYVGYDAGCRDAVIEDNYLIGGYPLALTRCGGRIVNNVLLGNMNTQDRSTYPDNSYHADASALRSELFVRRSRYEPGRAHVTVYNWDRERSVALDLAAAGVKPGDSYEITDVQHYFGPAVMSGTYDGGTVELQMRQRTEVTVPVGGGPAPRHTAPEFAVFVVTSRAADARR